MKPKMHDSEFLKMVKDMTSSKMHEYFIKSALEEHEVYLRFMSEAFLGTSDKNWYIIRAVYRRKKSLWREFEINGSKTLADLASGIIESMDWAEDHLHGFWFPDERRNRLYNLYGIFHEDMEDDPHPRFKTKDVKVSQVDWKKYPILGFVFDFGDGHEFDISLKGIKPDKSSDRQLLISLIDQRGVAPEQYPDE